MLVTPIVFAASIALGEVLVAERRFLFYALAPILYNVGIVLGTVLLHDRIGIARRRWARSSASFLHLGIRRRGHPAARPCGSGPGCGCGCAPCTSSCG